MISGSRTIEVPKTFIGYAEMGYTENDTKWWRYWHKETGCMIGKIAYNSSTDRRFYPYVMVHSERRRRWTQSDIAAHLHCHHPYACLALVDLPYAMRLNHACQIIDNFYLGAPLHLITADRLRASV